MAHVSNTEWAKEEQTWLRWRVAQQSIGSTSKWTDESVPALLCLQNPGMLLCYRITDEVASCLKGLARSKALDLFRSDEQTPALGSVTQWGIFAWITGKTFAGVNILLPISSTYSGVGGVFQLVYRTRAGPGVMLTRQDQWMSCPKSLWRCMTLYRCWHRN